MPNRLRAAWTSAETGFHSAKTRRTVGSVSEGTKALEMNVNGNRMMNTALFSVSGVETTRPTNTSTHENAHAKNSSRATPARNFGTPSLKRQPTARPASSMTIIETVLMAKSVKVRANSTAACDIGNVRNLSTMPSFRSCAMNVPENVAPNTTVWAKMPAMRNSV